MTLTNMRCDRCSRTLAGPADPGRVDADRGIRFGYHPGDPRMRDDSNVLCGECWAGWIGELGPPRPRVCARCAAAVTRATSLHLRRTDEVGNGWQLCAAHAVDLLNELRTVPEKLDVETFRFPLADGQHHDPEEESDD